MGLIKEPGALAPGFSDVGNRHRRDGDDFFVLDDRRAEPLRQVVADGGYGAVIVELGAEGFHQRNALDGLGDGLVHGGGGADDAFTGIRDDENLVHGVYLLALMYSL